MRNGLHKLEYLNLVPVRGTVQRDLGYVALLEEIYYWGIDSEII